MSRAFQKYPEILKDIQRYIDMLKDFLICPEISRHIQRCPETVSQQHGTLPITNYKRWLFEITNT